MDRLTVTLLMAGGFCCPMTTWTLFRGYLSLSDGFFVAALATHLLTGQFERSSPDVMFWLVVSAATFVVSGMITFIHGGIYSSPLIAFKLVFAMIVTPFFIALMLGDRRVACEWLLFGWLAGGTFSALVAFSSRHGVAIFGFFDPIAAAGYRAQGLGYHANSLGYTSALLVPVATYAWWRSRHLVALLIITTSMALLLNAIYISGSRASLVAVLLGALPWIPLLLHRNLRPVVLLIGLGLTTCVLMFTTIALDFGSGLQGGFEDSAITRLLGTSSAEGSDIGRQQAAEYSWREFLESPLVGVGWGAIRWAHGNVLSVLHSGGLLGMMAVVFWLMAILFAARRVALVQNLVDKAPWHRALLALALSSIVIWLVNGAFQPLLPDRNGYLLIGVLFALNSQAYRLLVAGAHASRGTATSMSLR